MEMAWGGESTCRASVYGTTAATTCRPPSPGNTATPTPASRPEAFAPDWTEFAGFRREVGGSAMPRAAPSRISVMHALPRVWDDPKLRGEHAGSVPRKLVAVFAPRTLTPERKAEEAPRCDAGRTNAVDGVACRTAATSIRTRLGGMHDRNIFGCNKELGS